MAAAGEIIQVSTSRGGVPKRPVLCGVITRLGLQGDGWAHPQIHGGPTQRILLIASEALDLLKAQGFPVFPGALGENLTTRGVDPRSWRAGQTWRAGSARLELTKIRRPCSTIKIYGTDIHRAIFDDLARDGDIASPVWGYSGFYASVAAEGVVKPGDQLTLESEVA